jgi:hypothetical protein
MAEQSFRSLYDFFKFVPQRNFTLDDVQVFTTGNLFFPGGKQVYSAYGSTGFANRLFYADSIAKGSDGAIRAVAKGVVRDPLGVARRVEILSPLVQVTIKPLMFIAPRASNSFEVTSGKLHVIQQPFDIFISNYVQIQSMRIAATGGIQLGGKDVSNVLLLPPNLTLQLQTFGFTASSDGTITVTVQALGPPDPNGARALIERTATVNVKVLAAETQISPKAAAGPTTEEPKAGEPTTTLVGTPVPEAVPTTVAATDPAYQAPVVKSSQVSVAAGGTVAVTLEGVGPEGSAPTFSVTQQPTHGTLSGQAPRLFYRPDIGFSGTDALAFTASYGAETSAEATITITVTRPPAAAKTTKRSVPRTKKVSTSRR